MGYAEAFINIQIIVQTIFEMPWYYDTTTETLIVNPKRKHNLIRRFFKMPIWTIVSLLGIVTFTMTITHLIQIGLEVNAGQNVSALETILYSVVCVCTLLGLVTIYTAEKDIKFRYSFIDTVTAIFVEGNVRHIGVPTTERLPDQPELIGYGIMAVFLCLPIIAAVWPLLLDVDPINRDFKGKIPEVPRRLLASVIYGFVTYIAANVCGLFLILVLGCCHIFEKHAENNLFKSKAIINYNNPIKFDIFLRLLSKHFLSIVEWFYPKWKTFNRTKKIRRHTRSHNRVLRNQLTNFSVRRHDHNIMNLLMDQSNRNVAVFIPTLAGVGIILCVVGNFGCISFYYREDLRVIWVAAVCFGLCVYWLIMFFCLHASKPLVLTEETIRYWKGRIIEKLERRQVRAMMSYGFTLGPFFKVKTITAFDIIDAILSHSINFLVASKS